MANNTPARKLASAATLALISIVMIACGSSEGAQSGMSANAEDLAGNWSYEVVGIDQLDIRTGTIRFVVNNGQLSGAFDAVHLNLAPLRNIRYRAGEATFTAQAVPGLQGGLAFSMTVSGDEMVGRAFLTSNSQAVATRSQSGANGRTVEVVARKIQ